MGALRAFTDEGEKVFLRNGGHDWVGFYWGFFFIRGNYQVDWQRRDMFELGIHLHLFGTLYL